MPIFRKVATGAANATARVKRPIGAATNSILRLGTGKFHLSSASLYDSQATIPLIQMSSTRAKILYDLADCAYDTEEIKAVSKKRGHIPVIDSNPRRRETVELPPARKIHCRERSTVERVNSDLKDKYGACHVRVKRHWKVLCHLMFGVIAITVKQLFNMVE